MTLPLYRFENYPDTVPPPRDIDIDHVSPAPENDIYGRIAWRHPARRHIVIRVSGFTRFLWTVCAGDRMLLTTYDRQRVERFVERVC